MARYRVTSNASEGFDGVYRGYPERRNGTSEKPDPGDYPAGKGWQWPKAGIVIEVSDEDEDPGINSPVPSGVERVIGRRTWQALQDDPRIFAGPVGGGDETSAKSAALAEANAKIAELEAKLAAAAGETPAAKGKGGK